MFLRLFHVMRVLHMVNQLIAVPETGKTHRARQVFIIVVILEQRVACHRLAGGGGSSSRCGSSHLGLLLSHSRHFLLVVRRYEGATGKTAKGGHDLALFAADDAARTNADHAGSSRLEEGCGKLLGKSSFSIRVCLNEFFISFKQQDIKNRGYNRFI